MRMGESEMVTVLVALTTHSAGGYEYEWSCVPDPGHPEWGDTQSCEGNHDDLVSLADVLKALGLSAPVPA